jgi:uncharacterized protein with HEPN domain
MREQLRDNGRLQHIIVSIDKIEKFTKGVTFEEYCSNEMMQFAVVKNLENIGEASYMLSKEFKAQHTEINWNDIIKMRHIMVHGYYNIQNDIVWAMITDDIPPLEKQIKQIMNIS